MASLGLNELRVCFWLRGPELLLLLTIKSINLNSCKNFNTQPLQAKHVLNILAQNFATNIQSQQRIYIIDVIDPKNLLSNL